MKVKLTPIGIFAKSKVIDNVTSVKITSENHLQITVKCKNKETLHGFDLHNWAVLIYEE